ncbi:DUF1343 domain-containing protein [Candidatus Sumerlaeota bacterium]|nr:DUF1343 domain-containing protein [Candidatus Sumerlaeota bacterium]
MKTFFRKQLYILLAVMACFAFLHQAMPIEEKEKEIIGNVYPGIDVLAERNFDVLKGKKVGLITNHTGISRDGKSDIDILFETKDLKLVCLFSPEHGIRGNADEKVDTAKDEKTGLIIHSLYGKTQKPTKEMLEGLDALVFDIQDIGTRFYTYIGTMAYAMRAAKEYGIKFVVLDRPNPIGGNKVEGGIPTMDMCGGNTCILPIPTRHGMTIGELAQLFNDHFKIGCDLAVVPMKNWKRWMYLDQTGLIWENPSPNMKTLNGAILYPGCGSGETTQLSTGRGLDRPFEMYGAPFADANKVAANLAKRKTPGVRFIPYSFTPTAKYHRFKDEICHGVFVILYDREALDSVTAGLHMVQAFYESHPDLYNATGGYATETGDKETWDLLTVQKKTPEEIVAKWKPAIDEFKKLREKYLLY